MELSNSVIVVVVVSAADICRSRLPTQEAGGRVGAGTGAWPTEEENRTQSLSSRSWGAARIRNKLYETDRSDSAASQVSSQVSRQRMH